MKFQPRDERQVKKEDWVRAKDPAAGGEAHLPAADNKIFPFASFVSTAKIVNIVRRCVQGWSVGPLVPRAECLSLFLCSGLWMLSRSSSAQNAAALFPHPANATRG